MREWVKKEAELIAKYFKSLQNTRKSKKKLSPSTNASQKQSTDAPQRSLQQHTYGRQPQQRPLSTQRGVMNVPPSERSHSRQHVVVDPLIADYLIPPTARKSKKKSSQSRNSSQSSQSRSSSQKQSTDAHQRPPQQHHANVGKNQMYMPRTKRPLSMQHVVVDPLIADYFHKQHAVTNPLYVPPSERWQSKP